MNIKLPVPMLPLSPGVTNTAGFVIAVLIGLALYAKSQQTAPTSKN